MRLGIDFGTTNSSVAYYDGESLSRLALDPANDNPHVLPSLLYIDRAHQAVVGTSAGAAYVQHETGRPVKWEKRRVGEIDVMAADMSYVQTVHVMVDTAAHGRLMQYIKTALRDPGYQGTQVFDRYYTLDELIAIVLQALKTRAEQEFGEESRDVVLGRPVRFSDDPAVALRAEEILFKAARRAGFQDIRFELEPIGAAYYYHRTAADRKMAFIFDFGGGTLDLTVAELGGALPPRVLGTYGVLVGGDDLDRCIMQSLRPYFGGASNGGQEALPAYFLDPLDNWQTMPILSRATALKLMDEFRSAGVSAEALAALKTLVTRNLGFKLFGEIEQAKKRLSEKHITSLDFEFEEIKIHEHITRREFEGMIAGEVERVEAGVHQALIDAGVRPGQVDVVLRTGGTSAVPVFTGVLARIFGEEKLAEMDLLTSVVGGLAIVAHEGGGRVPVYGPRYSSAEIPVPGTIRARSSRAYERYAFSVGAKCYRDKSYNLARIPVELSGLPAIRTAQEDKGNATKFLMQFDLAQPARVYVAHDAEARGLPDWLREFEPQKMQVVVNQSGTERHFRLFARDFDPGCVKLGGNCPTGQPGAAFMNYLVVVQAHL